jgi:hypothetical protein
MLYTFGFEQIGVLVCDLYFVDPEPGKGQELRALERGDLKGSIYSAQPLSVGQPIWRVDLLESVDGTPGSFDRTHHHPSFTGWEPGSRVFERELSADPIGWLGRKLSDLPELLKEAGVSADVAGPDDAASLRDATPEIVNATERLLARVRAGELGNPPAGAPADNVRAGWL